MSQGSCGLKADIPAADLAGEERQAAHDRGAHDRRGGAHQQGVEQDAQQGGRGTPPRAKQPAEQHQEQPGHDRHIKTIKT